MTTAAAFLDRDGVLSKRPPEHEYVTAVEEFGWLAGSAEGAARLAHAGFRLVVVSNQRGIARGLVTWSVLEQIEAVIQTRLRSLGCRIEAFRYCPHAAEDRCECRKPKPGLLLAAARELGLKLSESWMIGDSETDVSAGRAAGTRTALVGGGQPETVADLVAQNLDAASRVILHGRDGRAA